MLRRAGEPGGAAKATADVHYCVCTLRRTPPPPTPIPARASDPPGCGLVGRRRQPAQEELFVASFSARCEIVYVAPTLTTTNPYPSYPRAPDPYSSSPAASAASPSALAPGGGSAGKSSGASFSAV
jgi:hypothetical protein